MNVYRNKGYIIKIYIPGDIHPRGYIYDIYPLKAIYELKELLFRRYQ
jgi:hypothetical protein